jgi:hypothetical protein
MILMAAVVGSGAMVGVLAWLFYRTRTLEGRESGTLSREVDDLRGEIESIRGEMAKLQEQADFTERLLASGSASERHESLTAPD